MTERRHVSAQPVVAVASTPVQPDAASKPRGFWYDVGRDWERWCRAADWGWPDSPHIYQIDVDLSRVLVLDTETAIRAFGREYAGPRRYDHDTFNIAWRAVAARYAGIEIAPYQWGCRFANDTEWYYGWDCASGCIWDASVVTDLRAVHGQAA